MTFVKFIDDMDEDCVFQHSLNNTDELDNFVVRNKRFKILQHNIRSIHKNLDTLLATLNKHKESFDVIILSETREITNLNDNFGLDSFNFVYNHSKYNQNDGLVIFVKNCLNYNCDIVTIGLLKALRLTVTLEDRTLDIISVYKLHMVENATFLKHLNDYLDKHQKNDHIFMGDINIDILRDDDVSKNYLNIMAEHGFHCAMNQVTRTQKGNR